MTQPVKVALYLRQSLDRTGEGLAVDRQREACRKLAEARGWSVVGEYVDNSVSATNGMRPQWSRMLDDAGHGRFDVILAWALDRITRSMKDTDRLVDLAEKTGVRVVTANGDIDLTNDQGRLVGRILSAVARGEIERKSARQRLANQQRASKGLPPVGPRALGWDRDGVTLVPREAELVRRGYELVLTGGSLRGVVRLWNGAGLTTARGNPWAPYSVRDVLLNPRYAGLRAIRGEVVREGTWPAIVPQDVWRAVGAIMSDPARRLTESSARTYLLSGLARCHCGAYVHAGGRTRHGSRVYKCASGSKHLQRRSEPIDEYVAEVVIARLSQPDAADLLTPEQPDLAGLRTEAQSLRQQLDQLADDTELSLRVLTRRTKAIEARLVDVDGRLDAAVQTNALAAFRRSQRPRDAWDGLDLDQRRAVVDTLMEITLHSPGQGARRFRPETVEIQWKQP